MASSRPMFRLNGKCFYLTYPKHEGTKEALLEFLSSKGEIERYCIARELHEDGTPHLHAYVVYATRKNFKSPSCFDFLDKHGNYQIPRNKKDVIAYVAKQSDFIANFDVKAKYDSMLQKKRDISVELMSGKELHVVTKEHPELLFGYARLKKDIEQYKLDSVSVPRIYPRDCIWLLGEPGTGKSYWARTTYPTLFEKPQNKWWDGYNNEDVVLIDDLDSESMGHLLKIWADQYSFIGETKNGTIRPTYKTLIVTSNYHPDALFKDSMMAKAIARRFKFKYIDLNYSIQDF